MKIKLFLTIFIPFTFLALPLEAMWGSLPNEVVVWASKNGFTASPVATGKSGCLKGKRYVAMKSPGVKAYAVFEHPIYREATAVVSNVIFEFNPPVSKAKARSYAIKLAPIIGTRPPTHKQKIKPEAGNACIPSTGGIEERYTKDWILEFFPGGNKTQKTSMYNDYIR